MSEGASQNQGPDLDFPRRNGDDDDDIFKSAMESPMTDSERTIHGDDEIDLNDDDDELTDFQQKTLELTLNNDNDDIFKNGGKSAGGNSSNTLATDERDQTKPYSPDQGQSQPITSLSDVTHSNVEIAEKSSEPKVERKASSAEAESVDESQYLEITVTEPQKQGDGISGFIVYRVTTRTNIALFRRKEFAVWRRFSDFLGLHSKLAEKYLRKGRIVPPAPDKNMIGTTKVKITSGQPDPANQSDFLEKRRAGLERFMNRIAAHLILRVDPDFRDFLEMDSDLPKSTNTSAFSGAGVVRLLSKFGETVNKMSYKMDESDTWFEEKIQNIEALENQLRKVHTSIELLVVNRKELAHSTGTFAKSAAILSNAEEHTALARALAQLAEVEEKVEQMHQDQANSDFFLFSELLKDYIALIGSVKEVFHERVKAYQLWQQAQQTLNKKREAKARLELQVRNEKIGQAREEVVEWEAKVERSQEEFNTISTVIKKELEQFEVTRVKEFKKIIVKYLESLLGHQQELVKYWETFLPEAKAIV